MLNRSDSPSLILSSGLYLVGSPAPHYPPRRAGTRGTPVEVWGRRQAPAAGNAIKGGRRGPRQNDWPPGGHRAGCSPAVTRGSRRESHSTKVPRQTGAVWIPDGNLLTSWCRKQVSNLPRVIGRARGAAHTRTQVSWVPDGILSQACSSQPRLGPGRPSPPHTRSVEPGLGRPRPRTPAPQRQGLAAGPAFPRVRTGSPRRLSTAGAPLPGCQGRLARREPYKPRGGSVCAGLKAPCQKDLAYQ